jgi:HK97 family phage major capsid protein
MDKIIEKLDAIEQANQAKIAEAVEAVKSEVAEKLAALEAKVAEVKAPAIIQAPAKTIKSEVNKMVRSQLKEFVGSSSKLEKEIKLFESGDQYDAYMKEASALTGSGANVGGRTAYDPVFHVMRLANPMRGLSRNVSTDGATYQFRAKVGNTGPAWGYSIQNNGSATTVDTNIWQLTLQDLNVQFPIRTAALDDIDGLEANVVDDMLVEFSQAEGASMIQNDDQSGSATTTTGGTNGLRGLDFYPGANSVYAGGTTSAYAFGSSGTGASAGLHSLATYDQLTTNAAGSTNNVVFADIINLIHALPQQYWGPSNRFMISPSMLAAIRGLVDDNGTPVFERMSPLVYDGIVGRLLGYDVVVNAYVDSPIAAGVSAGTVSKYPMYFGDFTRGHTIVDRLNMVLRRYDQTAPGFITFYGEKRLACSVVDPAAIVRYRSTATGA